MIFLNPYLLFALLLLPLIWFFLKATPPRPREAYFPPIQLLHQIQNRIQESVNAPWWLLILRLLIVTLIIIGLAQPVFKTNNLNIQKQQHPLLLIIDNGWASAPAWSEMIYAADQILQQASQTHNQVHLLLTARDQKNTPLHIESTTPPSILSNQLHMIAPYPWSEDYQQADNLIKDQLKQYQEVYYVTNGIQQANNHKLYETLSHIKTLYEIRPEYTHDHSLSVLLKPTTISKNHITQPVDVIPQTHPVQLILQAYNLKGVLISSANQILPPHHTHTDITLTLPTELRNKVDYLKISNSTGASSVYLLNTNSKTHIIGLLKTSPNANTPFTGSLYYLHNALSPLGNIQEGTVDQLLSQPISILITPDILFTDQNTVQKLQKWIENGGTLVRFSGPLLAGASINTNSSEHASTNINDPFIPLPLLKGSRELGGAMTWEKPQHIADFTKESPFYGLSIPSDITITKQILTQPISDMNQYNWAQLEDGTPLVTHRNLGKGQIILFHTKSTPDWSSLPLSGLFVSMLERLVHLSNGVDNPNNTSFSAYMTLNSNGNLESASPYVHNLPTNTIRSIPLSPKHPPGLYGNASFYASFNIGDHIHELKLSKPIGKIIHIQNTLSSYSISTICLIIALICILIDAIIIIFLRGYLKKNKLLSIIVFITLFGYSFSSSYANVVTPSSKDALTIRLAYITTNNPDINLTSQEGLEGLSDFINTRTTLHLSKPVGVNPIKDDLAFYPVIYWPITPDLQNNPEISKILNEYMAHGGLLIIDTQGHDPASTISPLHSELYSGEKPNSQAALKRATEGLNIPALSVLSDKDLLSRTFYILHDFPGRYNAMPVWISQSDPLINDGVSSIIIGENDWAHAWAKLPDGNFAFTTFPNTDTQRKLAYRFGMNLVMYALTGSYKSDQLHVSALLQQLGTH